MIWLSLFLSYGFFASAGQLDPMGLLKAKLFVFEPKAEAISGIVNCEDELNNLIDGLGRRVAMGSSSEWLGAVAEDAYNMAIGDYRRERIDEAGGTVEERQQKMLALIPPHKEYQRRRLETPDSLKVEFVNYLVDEFARLEMAAIVRRSVRELEYHFSPQQRFPPLGTHTLPGERGRSYRLILFFRDRLPHIEPDFEPAFKVFADSLLTPEIIKQSISVHQLENTQGLFAWLYYHNHMLYLYFLEKYHPYIGEDWLHPQDQQ